jgi:hypothetical protein
LFEVVGDEIITINMSDSLVTSDGVAPPSADSLDVREYGVVRVDRDGNAEWAVLKGTQPTTRRIESEAERREVRRRRSGATRR